MTAAWRRREILALPGLLLLAAALRLPDLATRGTWDADQGHDMLMLRPWSGTASSRCSGRRPPSATSTTARCTTSCWPRRRR